MAAATWDTLAAPNVRQVDFVWHGGEVTLLDPEYFEKAITLQRVFKRSSQHVTNSLQTNATLITDAGCALWRKFEFSVGVSIDGLPHVHDTKRIDRRGAGAWDRVIAGLAMLREQKISHGALTVLCEATIAADPRVFLGHIAALGVDGVALLNAVPQTSGELTAQDEWLHFERFTEYLVALYAAWDRNYRHLFGIREFISLENNLTRPRPIICVHAARCVGQFLTVEPDGDVSPCEKFVGDPRFRFGNLHEHTCAEVLRASQNFETLRQEEAVLKGAMQTCTHAAICSGGYVHDALIKHLCEGEDQSACCGLAPLIETIAARYGGKNGA